MTYAPIVLASASPRRSALLTQIGVAHEVLATDLDEARLPGEPPHVYVERLARDKALAARAALGNADRVLLAADTSVVLGDEIFGKPEDEAHCVRMLMALSGRTHEVMTGIAVLAGETLLADVNVSRVSFRALDDEECRRYWRTGEPRGKAGGYAVQGFAATFIERIDGSYSSVMGLPLFETARLLAAAGVPAWRQEGA
ncbi:MAG: septum formation inhibitor Maf [Gammaproteobacteria bacterium]|nr:septum formation inhibitor Maf [Gammaproteobacteria bacterium]